MNKLQTKIAQNKINEKLRKSQELSQGEANSIPSSPLHTYPNSSPMHNSYPNSSPVQAFSSPEQNMEVDQSPVRSPSTQRFLGVASKSYLSTSPSHSLSKSSSIASALNQTPSNILNSVVVSVGGQVVNSSGQAAGQTLGFVPCTIFNSGHGQVSSLPFSSQSTTAAPVSNFHTGFTLSGYEQGTGVVAADVPPLPQVDTSFLATLAAQDNLDFQVCI